MSETDNNNVPPAGVMVAGDHGLTAWRPQYEGVEVTLVPFRKISLRCFLGEREIVMQLDPDQATHLASCLSEAARKAGRVGE